MRILIAGFQHETNTFAPSKADWPAFVRGDGFPAFAKGQPMVDALADLNIPIGGFVHFAREQGWQIKPSCWAGATPSAHVTREAFENISDAILADAAARDFDAIYLDLHGAAVAEHVDDCEGELLARLRAMVGYNMPIVVSLDSHANMTERMFALADALTCYRTYPHIDMAQTGRRAGELLQERFMLGERAPLTWVRIPYLIPLNAQSTMIEPNQSFMAALLKHDTIDTCSVSFAMGFPAADFAECAPAIWGYGTGAKAVVNQFAKQLIDERKNWAITIESAEQTVLKAIALAQGLRANEGPVVIADTQDNPGAGGDSNTTGVLHALLNLGAGKRFAGQVALGLLFDPESAKAAHEVGVGGILHRGIGKSIDTGWQGMSEAPVERPWVVKKLSDGHVTLEGPMMAGLRSKLGPCAQLEHDGVCVLVVSGKKQLLDKELYRFLGIEPATMKILVNKSSVHFRAAFAPIASHILVAKSPGPMAANPADLPWKHLPTSTAREP